MDSKTPRPIMIESRHQRGRQVLRPQVLAQINPGGDEYGLYRHNRMNRDLGVTPRRASKMQAYQAITCESGGLRLS